MQRGRFLGEVPHKEGLVMGGGDDQNLSSRVKPSNMLPKFQ